MPLRLFDHLLDLPDASGHGGEGEEGSLRSLGDKIRERGLPRARGTPEDHRRDFAAVESEAQHPALPKQVCLPHELLHRSGSHSVREGSPILALFLLCMFEEFHRSTLSAVSCKPAAREYPAGHLIGL